MNHDFKSVLIVGRKSLKPSWCYSPCRESKHISQIWKEEDMPGKEELEGLI